MHKTYKIFGVFMVFFFCLIAIAGQSEAKVIVQIMSGQDKAAATKEAERLFNLGIPAFTRVESVPDRGQWSRVYLGPFETKSDAKAAVKALQKQKLVKDYIIKDNIIIAATTPATNDKGPNATTKPMVSPPIQEEKALPVAQIPTYGEPVSQEQARELGLAGPAVGLTTAPKTTAPITDDLPFPAQVATIPPPEVITATMPRTLPASAQSQANPTLGLSSTNDIPVIAPTPKTPGASATPNATVGKPANPVTGLPEGLAPGDDLPGIAPKEVKTPAGVTSNSITTFPTSPDPLENKEPKAVAPSAGEGDEPIMLAQGTQPVVSYSYYDQPRSRLPMTVAGFTCLVDLSSSMRRLVDCGARVKEEAVAGLLRKINQRIPNHPYAATLRVFGYKMATTRNDFTTVYFGPEPYNRSGYEDAISRLIAADSVSPFATAINSADSELILMGNPKAVLMFSDFEESIGSGNAIQSASNLKRRYGKDIKIYTYYISRQKSAAKLARAVAKAGGGRAYNMCEMLDNPTAFSDMMTTVFGPSDAVPCPDIDQDGVCDADDFCGSTPLTAPVDERGCWVAAYSQFFDFDETVVKRAFLPRIRAASQILQKFQNIPLVTIAGHTDNIGNAEYNEKLGEQRAQAVKDILIKDGVNPNRLKVKSFGQTRPLGDNNTPEGRARNRRVIFHIGDVPNP